MGEERSQLSAVAGSSCCDAAPDMSLSSAPTARRRPEDATFEQCFYMSGGQGALEEVEALGNEASRLCNRARRNLSPARQSAFERQVTEFAPLFDLSSEVRPALPHRSDARIRNQAATPKP